MYSEMVQRILADPGPFGPLEGATHEGIAGIPGEGPYLLLWIQVEEDRILHAAFKTFGCPAAVASGSMVATLVTGRTVEKAVLLTTQDLLLILGGLPEGREFCAELAVTALQAALAPTRIEEREVSEE